MPPPPGRANARAMTAHKPGDPTTLNRLYGRSQGRPLRAGQQELLDSVDLVLTGEGKFDSQSLRGKLVTRIAAAGGATGVDTIVLAGQVTLTENELVAAGIAAAHSISEFAGSVEVAMSDAANQLEQLAARVATEVADSHVDPRRRA